MHANCSNKIGTLVHETFGTLLDHMILSDISWPNQLITWPLSHPYSPTSNRLNDLTSSRLKEDKPTWTGLLLRTHCRVSPGVMMSGYKGGWGDQVTTYVCTCLVYCSLKVVFVKKIFEVSVVSLRENNPFNEYLMVELVIRWERILILWKFLQNEILI